MGQIFVQIYSTTDSVRKRLYNGGEATNVVTDHVELKVEARSHDPDFRQQMQSTIENAFYTAVGEVQNVAGETGAVTIDSNLQYESFVLADDEPCVLAAEVAIRAIGREPNRTAPSSMVGLMQIGLRRAEFRRSPWGVGSGIPIR